ncbi:cytochrome c oxidase accessory protein CcoG [Pseudomonas panipatensis]|uniref:Cytochrome c oxidase accessory protein FixG n=1 Tax=Pseudomonas panipatensis TaxID=428992 RepID=A0A1G8EKT8_9PSED|nr:cytochrome c oxidase accessory protein CcoG [Pseudomonas panipatensis]SDH70461.1 cytochrome c oxidase accessory protein FixG [Pseudomonas panipatensis]SMP68264.1 cytochrome c oxidase accessory protein FixG [Pseudomonas panipatensis]
MSERIPARIVEISAKHLTTPPPKPLSAVSPPIYTKRFSGRFRDLRRLGGALLFLLFFGTLWLQWDGRQAVLWDLPERKFYIFGATFWPQDFILLSAILIIAAFGLFFITVFAGRVWCGYTCPQSVWTWIFMWCEQLCEGDRNQRMKLDKAPLGAQKLLRKGAKHGLWLLVSLVTGLTFIGYFTPVRPLLSDLFSLRLDLESAFWVAFFSAATYANAGWLREQVCIHMCPYSRFQSVMFDQDTLVISYDAARGESRGARKKDAEPKALGLGDCIDCQQCVQVCPTGIDIRDGLQIACIGCAACVDACDTVMDKMGYARGLVRYTSERALAGGQTRLLRPRLVGYAAVLLVMLGAFAWALQARPLIALDVARDRGLFRENAAGEIENVYNLKLINKTQQAQRYRLGLAESAGYRLQGEPELRLAPGEIRDFAVSVAQTAPNAVAGSRPLAFRVSAQDSGETVEAPSTFVAPRR